MLLNVFLSLIKFALQQSALVNLEMANEPARILNISCNRSTN